jgi:hypothetical protein
MRVKLIACFLMLLGISKGKLLELDALYASESDEFLFSQLYNETMEWGTYKPNQYFAVKDRSATPLTVAMMWVVPIPGQGF